MKPVFFSLFMLSVFSINAQEENENNILKFYLDKDSVVLQLPLKTDFQTRLFMNKSNWIYLNKNRLGTIYALPQCNMPCIVPDMEEHTTMPNPGLELKNVPAIDPHIYSKKPKTIIRIQ